MRIAIVYDWIDSWGGVERMLLVLHEMFPEAEFYTSFFDEKKASWAKDLTIKTSFMQKFPQLIKRNRILSLPFFPYAFESFDFSDYDLVVSVTSSFAKYSLTKPTTKHICILLTPTRYFWNMSTDYIKRSFVLSNFFLSRFRFVDSVASIRPDMYVAISKEVQKRALKYYHVQTELVYPPFDINYWQSVQADLNKNMKSLRNKFKILPSEFYLTVSRLEPYKKIDLLIETFNTLQNKKLVIVGTGSLREQLKNKAGSNIFFLEHVSDINLAYLYSKAEALVMPQYEEFGYTALESQFFNCPVIAFEKGGASETVLHEKTGYLFKEQTVYCLCQAIAKYEELSYTVKHYSKLKGKQHLEQFSKEKFEKAIKKYCNI